jgi:hypothetical protein
VRRRRHSLELFEIFPSITEWRRQRLCIVVPLYATGLAGVRSRLTPSSACAAAAPPIAAGPEPKHLARAFSSSRPTDALLRQQPGRGTAQHGSAAQPHAHERIFLGGSSSKLVPYGFPISSARWPRTAMRMMMRSVRPATTA